MENEISEEEKSRKCQYTRNLYGNLSKEKTPKSMNMHVENIETFLKKKKIKSVIMLANDIEIFLKNLNILCMYKNYFRLKSSVLSGKCEKVF